MPRTHRKVLLVPLLAGAVLLGAGCSTTVPGTAAPTGGSPASTGEGGGGIVPTDDPVAWMDQVCGVLLPVRDATDQPPNFDTSGSPEQALEQLQELLTSSSTTFGTAVDGLRAVGPSPIEGGDLFVQQMTDGLSTVQASFERTTQALEDADPGDPGSLADALGDLSTGAGLQDLPSPTESLESNPELAAAAEQAPNCQEIQLGGN